MASVSRHLSIYHYRRPFQDRAVRSIALILALCRLTHVIPFPACAYWQGPEFRFFPPIRLHLRNYYVFLNAVLANCSTDNLPTVLIIASPPINPIYFAYFSDSTRPLATNPCRGHRAARRRRCGEGQCSRDRDGR